MGVDRESVAIPARASRPRKSARKGSGARAAFGIEMSKRTSIFDQLCTPAQAAEHLKLSEERVLQFCRQGRLEARQFGRGWVLLWASVREFAKQSRPEGRPAVASD